MQIDIDKTNELLERAETEAIIEWAVDQFSPELALSSSFQTQSLPLLHMVSRVAPDLPVLFLDTGYHFPETLAFRDRLVREWDLNVRNLTRLVQIESGASGRSGELYRTDPDLCCHINKVEPMRTATEGLKGWISGIRRDQSSERANIRIVEQTSQGLFRVHPMAKWTSRDVFRYIAEHDLPEHPLLAEGYLSVGCAPCTRPATDTENERSGRWLGQAKTECGLHTELRKAGGTEVDTNDLGGD